METVRIATLDGGADPGQSGAASLWRYSPAASASRRVLPVVAAVLLALFADLALGATQPDRLRFSVPSGTNNASGSGTFDCTPSGGGLDCPPNSDFTDDIFLEEIEFGAVTFRAADDEIIAGQASKVIDEDSSGSVNAEYGDDDDGSDGDDDPFTKSGNPGANQESTDPAIRDPAIREAFDNLSVTEGIDGEGPNFTLRFSFEKGVKDNDPGADGQPELIFFERGLNSDTRIELIIGGTFENPVKTDPLVITAGEMLDSGISIDTVEIGGGQALGVVGVDLSEFSGGGFDPATDTVFGMDFGSAAGGADLFGGIAAICKDNCEPNIFNAVAEYRMDESAWDGTAGEVTDETGNGNDGTAQNGATTAISTPDPAIPGDPGTCRYGEFDGADDYVEVSNLSDMLGGTATLTFWIHTTQTGDDTGWQAPGVTGVEQASGTDDIMWGWIDASGRIGVSVGNDFGQEQKSTTAINDGAWHHVALTRDATTGDTKVYVDGVLENSGTTGAGTIGTSFSSLGRIEDTGGSPEHYAGRLDEVRIYGEVLTDSGVRAIRDATHPCAAASFCPSGSAFSDSFEDGELSPWQATGGSGFLAGVDNTTADDGAQSAFTRGGEIFVESPTIDLSGATAAEFSVWIRRGANSFSDFPEAGEGLEVQYRNASNNWVSPPGQSTFPGGGTPGEVFEPSYTLPADAFHADFQVRFHQLDGDRSGGGPNATYFDYWHMDSVCVTASIGGVDHYAISHSGTLVSCDQETVTITAHDTSDSPVEAGNATIDLSTDTGEGTWARVLSGSGTLSDTAAGDGAGSYTFPDNGETAVELAFNYTSVNAGSPETVNFDVVDGAGITENGAEDPDLTVSHSGFRITDGNGNPIDIPSQIAAKPSNTAPGAQSLALQAIRTSDSDPAQCEPAFPDGTSVEVELGAECRNPATCAGNELAVTNDGNTTEIDTSDDNGGGGTASYEALDLTFGPNAEAPLELAYPDAGALQLHARANPINDGTGTPPVVEYIMGSSNDFVVRPFGFFVDFDPDGDTVFDDRASNGSCGDQTSCAGDANGDVFVTSGVDFPVRLKAVVWESQDDDAGSADPNGIPDSNQAIADNALTPNFGNEASPETVDLARTLVAPSGGNAGSLSGAIGIGGFNGGEATATGIAWNEVGIIDLAATLSDGAYLSGGDITGTAPNLGRFIPARLEATGHNPAFAPFCSSGTPFTYLDQAFGYETDPQVTVTAYNASGAVTANYGAAFWKLPVSPGPIFPNRDYAHAPPPSATLTDDRGSTTVSWADGGDDGLDGDDTATIAGERLEYGRSGLEGPFDAAVDLTIPAADLTDSDGVCPAASGICNTNDGDTGDDLLFDGDSGTAGQQPIAGTELRFGRLRLDDAYGPEVAPVIQRWQLDYWTGTTWARNGDDTCTALALANEVELDPDDDPTNGNEVDGTQNDVDLSSGDGTTEIEAALDVTAGSILFTNGLAEVRYEAPGAGNRGWIETRALLAADFPHLLADTNGDGIFDNEPSARVTFGIFSGDSEQIYLREVFPAP